ncbi:MAG: VCBS repeat-containing protein [bacterium]|nr:VCBS repeat-containing protein [bacterium]
MDYNNDGLKDLLVIYADGTIKLQKQYQDKNFKNMETLLLSAEQIQEVFVGDIDGNHYQDILIKNTKHQLRAYLNDGGKFDVDGRIACLNTNVAQGKISETPQLLSGVNQLFIQDMDQDNTLDIVTFDKMGDIKIFYGKGNKDQHSYLSTNPFHCDNQRYIRQNKQTKLVQNIGIQLNNKAVKDQSLVRLPGLKLPTDEQLTAEASKQSTASVLDTLPASIKNQLNKAESGASDIDTDAL